ncbi:MAG TPA: proline dehydrogenase family protein [Pelobium sp.]|nr:proline dehydrogenase family protein [Pelobium sp.]
MEKQKPVTHLSFEDTEVAFKHLSDTELRKSYWLFKAISNWLLARVGPFFAKTAIFLGLPISGLIKATLFKQFCGGETINDCTPVILRLFANGVGTILDYSVEGGNNEKAFDHTAEQILNSIKKAVEMPDAIPFCVFKVTGLARFSLLEKVVNGSKLEDFEEVEWQKAVGRIDLICKTGSELYQPVMIDAEESWIQDAIDEVAISMMKKYNQQRPIVFNTYQLYRTDKLNSLISDLTIAKTHKFILGAKLVRGAYMDKERKRAKDLGCPSPIHPNKQTTDRDFNAAVSFCLDNIESLSFIVASHNEHSCKVLVEKMEQLQIFSKHTHIYFAQLLGMSDRITFNLAKHQFNVAKYVPYGPLKSVFPYLLRRAEENSAITGQMGRELELINRELKRRKGLVSF